MSQIKTIREGLLILRRALDYDNPLRFNDKREKEEAENKARRAIALALELLEERGGERE